MLSFTVPRAPGRITSTRPPCCDDRGRRRSGRDRRWPADWRDPAGSPPGRVAEPLRRRVCQRRPVAAVASPAQLPDRRQGVVIGVEAGVEGRPVLRRLQPDRCADDDAGDAVGVDITGRPLFLDVHQRRRAGWATSSATTKPSSLPPWAIEPVPPEPPARKPPTELPSWTDTSTAAPVLAGGPLEVRSSSAGLRGDGLVVDLAECAGPATSTPPRRTAGWPDRSCRGPCHAGSPARRRS